MAHQLPPSARVLIARSRFGALPDGAPVDVFTLTNAHGLELRAMTYGGIIISLRVPDRRGHLDDIVLGFDEAGSYSFHSDRYFGAIVGRHANRIAKGRFDLDGRRYQLSINNGPHHLHGGVRGFHDVAWRAVPAVDGTSVVFTYTSSDGEEGYPGTLTAHVTYVLTDANALVVDYVAATDTPTVINLSHHTYFNLAGQGSRDVLDHELEVDADRYTPIDETLIPTGELASVEGTPFDFRVLTPIGRHIRDDDTQLRRGRGYDHNFVLTRTGGGIRRAARVVERSTGRTLHVTTTEPGVQVYTGNFLDGSITGKEGRVYRQHYGFCLETQHFPDSPNKPHFPPVVLRPGGEFRSRTVFTFGTEG